MRYFNFIKKNSSEIYLLLAVLYYWFLTSHLINPIAIVLFLILLILIKTQHKILGLISASLLIIINLYMVLALVSELSEFTIRNKDFYSMLLIGGLFLGLNIIMASIMLYKYAIFTKENKQLQLF